MKKLLVPALAALAGLSAPALATEAAPARVDVAYEALAEGRTAEAIARLDAESSDPSTLINLGTAYARQGRIADARAAFTAAMRSQDQYYVELADGSWVDSRKAAKMALQALDKSTAVALR